jgi:hypothetical protein
MGTNGVADDVPGSDSMRRIGRPTRLTPTLAAQLVAAVRETGWLRPAALRCGVNEATVREWVQQGNGEHQTRPATRKYAAFAADIARAQGEWEARQLAVLDAAAAKKAEAWGAAAWKLERFDRERYGRRERLDLSGMIALTEVRALLLGVVQLVERYVPPPGAPGSRDRQPGRPGRPDRHERHLGSERRAHERRG